MTARAFHIAHIVPPSGSRSAMHGLYGYREVIETVAWGLGQMGHRVSVGENQFRGDCTNIVVGAQMLSHADLARLPAETIVYNFEQIAGITLEDLKPTIRLVLERFRIWDYSEANIDTWRALKAARGATAVPVGWAPVLARIPSAPTQDIDVLLYGVPGPLRLSTFGELCERGLTCMFVCGMYGPARDQLIGRSKIVLNINRHRSRIFEVVRVSYLLANGKAVVADRSPETIVDPDFESAVAFCEPAQIVAECERLLVDTEARRQLELRARATMERRLITTYLHSALS